MHSSFIALLVGSSAIVVNALPAPQVSANAGLSCTAMATVTVTAPTVSSAPTSAPPFNVNIASIASASASVGTDPLSVGASVGSNPLSVSASVNIGASPTLSVNGPSVTPNVPVSIPGGGSNPAPTSGSSPTQPAGGNGAPTGSSSGAAPTTPAGSCSSGSAPTSCASSDQYNCVSGGSVTALTCTNAATGNSVSVPINLKMIKARGLEERASAADGTYCCQTGSFLNALTCFNTANGNQISIPVS